MPPPSSIDGPLTVAAGGIRLAVRLTPRARGGDRLDGVATTADGATVLRASVAAPPEDGRANAALLRLLAKEWKLPHRDLAIVAGAKSRNKTLHIAGDTAVLLSRLQVLLAALPGA